MNRYESYKPSDIDWVGEIPSHWETVQPKYKLNRVTRPIDDEDEVITCFRDGVVTLRKNRREDGFTNSVKEHGYQQIHPGDLVVHEMDGFAGAIGISDSKGKSTPVYTVVEPDDRADLKYIAYLLREMSQTGKIESLARSIRERTTDFRWNMWSVIHFPFPPIEEQKLISRYLDKKTNQIDSLVEKIQKKIELLKEQRTSLINHYVTKGLDPNVEMKDSGIEWVGEIPKHWFLKKITHVTNMMGSGTTPKSDNKKYYDDGNINWLVTGDLNDDYIFQTSNKITQKALNELSSLKIYPENSLLIAMYGATIGKLGILKIETTVNQATCVLNFDDSNSVDFWFYVFLGNRNYLVSLGYGGGQPNISQDVIKGLRFPSPPTLEEQLLIVNKIRSILRNHDKIIQVENTRIKLLHEYRQSLISSVVTGKVRVTEDMI